MVTVEVVVAFCVIGSFALVFYDMSEFCSTCTGIFHDSPSRNRRTTDEISLASTHTGGLFPYSTMLRPSPSFREPDGN